MTVVRIQPPIETRHLYHGLSTDEKPGYSPSETGGKVPSIPMGSEFIETDTQNKFEWHGAWVSNGKTLEGILADLSALTQRTLDLAVATHRGHEKHLWQENVAVEHIDPESQDDIERSL